MTPEEREAMRKWVQNWKELGPILEDIRQQEVRQADNRLSLELLEPAFNQALEASPLREWSGLFEMQDLFAKLR